MQPRSAAWCGDGVTDARYSAKATPEPLTPPLTFRAGAGGPVTLKLPYRGQIQVDVVDGVGAGDEVFERLIAAIDGAYHPL